MALANRFESLEDERALTLGARLMGFHTLPGERIDSLLARFDRVRHEAELVGYQGIHYVCTLLIRAVGVGGQQLAQILHPTN